MRLGVDASNLRRGGGVTHLRNILRYADPERFGIKEVTLWAAKAQLDLIEDRPWLIKCHQPALEGNILSRLFWQKWTLNRLAADSCDLLFAPGGLCSVRSVPYVTMCRNLIPFMWTELWRYGLSYMALRSTLLRFGQLRSFRKAEGLIFLSRYCLELLGTGMLPDDIIARSVVIPHGVETSFLREPKDDGGFKDRDVNNPIRVRYISIIDVYKHQWTVVEAIGALRRQGYPVELSLIGPSYPKAGKKLAAAMSSVDPTGAFVHYFGQADYDDIAAMYRECDLFVFASSCESFGMILLEAMASGLPIASSNRTTLPEILDGCGLYFNPEDATEIANALKRLIESDQERGILAHKAFVRAGEYSWERTARDTMRFIAETAAALSITSNKDSR